MIKLVILNKSANHKAYTRVSHGKTQAIKQAGHPDVKTQIAKLKELATTLGVKITARKLTNFRGQEEIEYKIHGMRGRKITTSRRPDRVPFNELLRDMKRINSSRF